MSIKENITRLKEKIDRTCERAGRSPNEISIVAVTKTVTPQKIEQAIANGIKIIGENRIQEAKKKFPIISSTVQWHMVGHLQTNKVKDALKIFSLIHSLDSIKLAQEIEKRAEKPIDCLIEVNTSKEVSKFGIASENLLSFFESLNNFKKINVLGLMTIGPGWTIEDPEASRPCFRLLHKLREELVEKFGRPFPVLSMGMTSDFEVAIEQGSTMIRVGTAIFGPREQ
ncbi:unnamed protein product [marine sediment metagenome]|uniref:Alanine racemase N-terminal domain-containing protein n=1 Tax=marine sediment metagenome TaxID=412755 RepID=X1N1C6_9ZZZZ